MQNFTYSNAEEISRPGRAKIGQGGLLLPISFFFYDLSAELNEGLSYDITASIFVLLALQPGCSNVPTPNFALPPNKIHARRNQNQRRVSFKRKSKAVCSSLKINTTIQQAVHSSIESTKDQVCTVLRTSRNPNHLFWIRG